MCEIWANYLLPKALKTCPMSNKSPNLVTLIGTNALFLSGFLEYNLIDQRFDSSNTSRDQCVHKVASIYLVN